MIQKKKEMNLDNICTDIVHAYASSTNIRTCLVRTRVHTSSSHISGNGDRPESACLCDDLTLSLNILRAGVKDLGGDVGVRK